MSESWKNEAYWERYWHHEAFPYDVEGEEELRWPEDDHDPYWDVLGDGWNPGHTMHPGEMHLELRTLSCFREGWVDYKRGIYWKYSRKKPSPERFKELTREEVGLRLRQIVMQSLDELNTYEVEPNE